MFRLSVAQKPTMAVSCGWKIDQKDLLSGRCVLESKSEPRSSTEKRAQANSARLQRIRKGAAKTSTHLIDSIPVTTIATCRTQNARKHRNWIVVIPRKPSVSVSVAGLTNPRTDTIAYRAAPPIHVWMPNQPQATRARAMAGMWAPTVPKLERARTGKGMPYLVPPWPLSIIGTSTIRLPSKMVRTACHQFMPASIIPPANM